MDYKRLREKTLEKYYPSEDELEGARQLYTKISGFIKDEFSMETHFAGSISRGTAMKGDQDIDIFVLFPEDTERVKLENQGLTLGKAVFKEFSGEFEIDYAEHPYTRGTINGHDVEIVPCYDVEPDSIQSAVDRTPHHSKWVEDRLTPEQRKDVVILKQFLNAGKLYGSSLKVEGFSGYLCEVLMAEHGSFEELFKAAVDWERQQLIDPEDHHEDGLPERLEKKFSNDSLVVIDPVDPERNVASVLSDENYAKFLHRCWQFLESPGMDFFEPKTVEVTEFELKQEIEKRGEFMVIEFDTPDEVDDIVYPQMRKTLGRMQQLLKKHSFRLFESGFFVGENTRIFFELERQLPEVEEKQGPSVFHGADHIAEFSSKYDNVFVRGDRLYAKTEREFTDAKNLLKEFLKDDLKAKGIPGNIAAEMEDFRFVEPVGGSKKWLKYLAEKLHVNPS